MHLRFRLFLYASFRSSEILGVDANFILPRYRVRFLTRTIESMSNRYAFERGIPTLPGCAASTMSLRFDGKFLNMQSGKRTHTYHAVSGQPDGAGTFQYMIERQRQRDAGPIPHGRYWVQPSQLWTNRWFKTGSRAAWGNYRLAIHVWPGTETYGRGGFFIHGGDRLGSAGCIDLHAAMDRFVADLREATSSMPHCYLSLSVHYPT